MTPKHIEDFMTRKGINWKPIVKNMWAVIDPEGKIPRITISIEPSERAGEELIKFIVFICDVPLNSPPEFYKQFLKLNFKVDHGAFAMESKSELCFIDTLELSNTDEVEFEATLRAMMGAPRWFQEHFDIDSYTLGKPQF